MLLVVVPAHHGDDDEDGRGDVNYFPKIKTYRKYRNLGGNKKNLEEIAKFKGEIQKRFWQKPKSFRKKSEICQEENQKNQESHKF